MNILLVNDKRVPGEGNHYCAEALSRRNKDTSLGRLSTKHLNQSSELIPADGSPSKGTSHGHRRQSILHVSFFTGSQQVLVRTVWQRCSLSFCFSLFISLSLPLSVFLSLSLSFSLSLFLSALFFLSLSLSQHTHTHTQACARAHTHTHAHTHSDTHRE